MSDDSSAAPTLDEQIQTLITSHVNARVDSSFQQQAAAAGSGRPAPPMNQDQPVRHSTRIVRQRPKEGSTRALETDRTPIATTRALPTLRNLTKNNTKKRSSAKETPTTTNTGSSHKHSLRVGTISTAEGRSIHASISRSSSPASSLLVSSLIQ